MSQETFDGELQAIHDALQQTAEEFVHVSTLEELEFELFTTTINDNHGGFNFGFIQSRLYVRSLFWL